jgi:hypothetical protein
VTAGPVVVLTYPHSGSELLRSLLADHPELACTTGTGLVPLCEEAALTWRQAEGRDNPVPSSLATASIRAFANGVITTILAATGKRRWCEIATAPAASAETFARLFPGTRFLCLHRACPDVICAGVQASPWGLTIPGIQPFAAAYPGNSAAALAAYWAARTESLIEFEQNHRGACLQIKYEELAGCSGYEELAGCSGYEELAGCSGVAELLGLDQVKPGGLVRRARSEHPGQAVRIPSGQLPPELHGRVDALLDRLGYPSLALSETAA